MGMLSLGDSLLQSIPAFLARHEGGLDDDSDVIRDALFFSLAISSLRENHS